MRYVKYGALLGILLFATGYAQAQVSVRVGVGFGPVYQGYVTPPVCPYGYFDYYPFACAPYGYYGPAYFVRGVFIGVGPWYRGHFDRDRFDRDRRFYFARERDGRNFDRGRDFRFGDHGRGSFRDRGDFRHGDNGRREDFRSFGRGNEHRGGRSRGDRGERGHGRHH
jgi:hypothetical protein